MATLQYALKRGIEAVYQLEESELMAEPLPKADLRRAILFYESAEGGAGVLTRIATEPEGLAQVAAEALAIMHYQRPANGHWEQANLTDDLGPNGQPICEAGCYKCLLSYYNQPDHIHIDRQDADNEGKALDILCQLTRSHGEVGSFGRTSEQQKGELQRIAGSSLEQAWLDYLQTNGYRAPDSGQHTIERCQTTADFYYADWKAAIFIDGPHHEAPAQAGKDQSINACLEAAGYYVVRFPKEIDAWAGIFKAHADLFGAGNSTGNNA